MIVGLVTGRAAVFCRRCSLFAARLASERLESSSKVKDTTYITIQRHAIGLPGADPAFWKGEVQPSRTLK